MVLRQPSSVIFPTIPLLSHVIVDLIGQLSPQVNQALLEVVLGKPSISDILNCFPSLLYDCGLDWTTLSLSQSSTF
jgi:hypothetical protein